MAFKKVSILVLALIISQMSFADVKLPALVSNGMILQRNKVINIWGWADADEHININFKGKNYFTVTPESKKWTLQFPAMEAGGPYEMVITGKNTITIKDILIGDVWLASGQSNMEFEMVKAEDLYADEIANANNPYIRQFEVGKRLSFTTPLKDVVSDGWKSVTPKNILNFTAVGYFFAKYLYERYKVPIGLINASWGGTPAEAWVSEEGLKAFPDFQSTIANFKDKEQLNSVVKNDKNTITTWYDYVKAHDSGLLKNGENWANSNTDTRNWDNTILPSYWTENILKNVNAGVVWYQREFDVPDSLAGKKSTLYLGNIYNQDSTWINGIKVGHNEDKHVARVYNIPEGVLKSGKNSIFIRVLAWASPPGFVKEKPYKLLIDKNEIDLTGTWKYKLGVSTKPLPPTTNLAYQPAVLFKGMIKPLIPYTLKGVIWYQGEANSNQGFKYQSLFPALINDWRKQWHQGDFPFLYVQLPNYLPVKPQPSQSSWAELREAQLLTLAVPNTGMAVTYDVGEWNDIHPHDKKDVGYRLSLAARKLAYHEDNIVYSGPIYIAMKKKGNKIILDFKNIGSGLVAKGGKPLKYFAIAGEDKKFIWAHAKIKGNTVVVWNSKIKNPIAVRYAWADNPDGANLYNKDGLPASPFRTDSSVN